MNIQEKTKDMKSNEVERRKLINKLWKDSYIKNKKEVQIFSFSTFRQKLEENGFTEKEHKDASDKYIRPILSKIMSSEELNQWIFHPTKEQLDIEDYLESSFDGSILSSISFSSENSSIL